MKGLWPADANKLRLLKTPGIHLIKWLLHSPELAGLGPTPMHRKPILCFSQEASTQPLCLLHTWWRGGSQGTEYLTDIGLRNYGACTWLSQSSDYLSLVAAPYPPCILVISLMTLPDVPRTETRTLMSAASFAAAAQVWGSASAHCGHRGKSWI